MTMTLEELRESLDVGCLPDTDRPRWFAAIDAAIRERADLWSKWQAERCFLAKAEAELAEIKQTLDLRWKADMRAIEQWRVAHPGNELVMPDHADMCVWLMSELAAVKARIAEAPVYEIPLSKPKSEDGWARVIESVKNERSVRGKRVRLVVEE